MENLKKYLQDFKEGKLTLQEVLQQLKDLPYENLKFAHLDHHRSLRQGFPEVIYGKGKTDTQIKKIALAILEKGSPLLITRVEEKIYRSLKAKYPHLKYNKLAQVISTKPKELFTEYEEKLVIVSAGTSDMSVAEEAYETALVMGFRAKKIYDVGVSGLHRLLNYKDDIERAGVLIVVAGMEGALASVVGGLVSIPIIAVPTSTGYGASFRGLAALLAMLNSCASGVTVVNIDNGFGAAFAACKILRLAVNSRQSAVGNLG
jgi:NCAIR mutase (PurE)-related protein